MNRYTLINGELVAYAWDDEEPSVVVGKLSPRRETKSILPHDRLIKQRMAWLKYRLKKQGQHKTTGGS